MNTTRTTRIGLGIGIALLLVAAGVDWWWQAQVHAVRATVVSQAQQMYDTRAQLANAASAKAQLASLSSDETAVHAYLVSESDIVSFLNVLEAAGRSVGAKVSIASVAPAKQTSRPLLTVAAHITGSFSKVMDTVGAIEHVPYYVTTQTLTLDYVHTKGAASYWTGSLTLLVGAASSTTP